jgi:hypothetical protein
MLNLHAPERMRAMAQFRLGSHWLAVQQGRFERHPDITDAVLHAQIEDELHVLLECPLYADLRGRYEVFTRRACMSDMHINEQFNKQNARDWKTFAEFLVQFKNLKTQVA